MNSSYAYRVSFIALISSLAISIGTGANFWARAAAFSGAESAFASEKGKFRINVGGQQVGKEEFEIGQSGGNWVAHGTSEIASPGGVAHVNGTLSLRPDGTPVHYEWSTAGAKKAGAAIDFSGVVATIQLHLENARPFTQQFTFDSPRVAVLDNNLYHQYAILAHLYDWQKKGAQTVAVLVPQEMTPGVVNLESLGKVEGKFEELRVKTEDLELDLFLDNMKLVRIVVPSSNAEIFRD